MNLSEILKSAPSEHSGERAAVHVQITAVTEEATKGGKAYCTLEIADGSAKAKVKVWEAASFLPGGEGGCVEIAAAFFTNQYGLNMDKPRLRLLTEAEETALFSGDAAFAARNEADWLYLRGVVDAMTIEALRLVVAAVLTRCETKYRRAAAAFGNHHARRGGLLEHTAEMLRMAQALAPLYPEVTPDLLFAGVILHDLGKVVESDYPDRGFEAQHTLEGVLMGHIAMGASLLSGYWFKLCGVDDGDLRAHLVHLILSHHGQLEWGSPVEPKTPEAVLLHQIDMIGSRMEMFRRAYRVSTPKDGLIDGKYPMKGKLAVPFSQGKLAVPFSEREQQP